MLTNDALLKEICQNSSQAVLFKKQVLESLSNTHAKLKDHHLDSAALLLLLVVYRYIDGWCSAEAFNLISIFV